MKKLFAILLLLAPAALAQAPANLVVEGVPQFPEQLVERTRPYFEFRTAGFSGWNPVRREMLIGTRFGDVPQIHLVRMPGGARKQLTFFPDRVGGGRFLPKDPNTILFSKDIGGNEFFQIYRMDLRTGDVTMLTDGKSRNTGGAASHDGKWIAFSSTRRTGRDTDVWVMNPMDPQSARMVLQVEGGGWSGSSFSPDGSSLVVSNRTSAAESTLYLLDLGTGEKKQLTPAGRKASYSGASFSADGKSVYFTTDDTGEFEQLVRMDLATGKRTVLSKEQWDVEDYDVTEDGRKIAYVTNENGRSVIHLIDAATGAPMKVPAIPTGTISNVSWHPDNQLLGLTISSNRAPADAYSIDFATGKLERWTESETGGLNPAVNSEPQLASFRSFDGTEISAFVYRPDSAKFPGKRPVLMIIHGGPEGQSRPGFLGRNNYWINELGIALVYPNVRGSTGYGKTFLAMDNGTRREDSVRDIGALMDWIAKDPGLDATRIGVYGGSYGGYMTLAAMTHYNDRIRAGIDVVGISNWLTFLQNTSDYRRDLRRVEYGDERDPKMKEFLQRISPMTNAAKISKPLFVIAGFNDPRVPWTEGEQMVKTIRANGGPVWWLMAKDEGHGFAKKRNVDYQFLAMTSFLEEHLVK